MCHLNHREIRDIVISTIRANRRSNERILGSLESVDGVFEFLNERNLTLTEKQWDLFDESLDVICGQNLVHSESRDFIIARMAEYKFPVEFIDALVGVVGYIYLYADVMINTIWYYQHLNEIDAPIAPQERIYAMHNGESTAHYARRITLFFMAHERRHTCQQFADIVDDYGTEIMPTSVMLEEHDLMQCEIDANNSGYFQTNDPMGMYTYAF